MTPVFTKSAIGRGAVWSILNQSFGQILVLLVFLVTARFVSKEAFGVMALCLMVVEAFRQIAIESIGVSIVAKKDPTDQDYNACFIVIAVCGLVSAVLIFILADPIATFLKNSAIADGLRWISLLLLTTGLSKTHEVWLAKHLQFKVLALRSMVSIVIGGSVGIWMAIKGFGLLSLIAQQLLTALIGTLTLWAATRWRPGLDTRRENMLSLFRYSRHVSMNAVASFANTQSDVFFSSYYLGAASTGVYSAAKRIITAVNLMLASGLNSVALPVQASLYGDKPGSARAYLKSIALTSLLTAPLFVGLAVLSNEVIIISLGTKWLDAASVLSILTITAYLFTISQYNGNALLVYDKPHWLTIMGVINAVANVVMLLIFARYGLIALAWAYTIKTIVLYPLSVGTALHILDIKTRSYLASLIPTIMAAVIMGLIIIELKLSLEGWSAWARLLVLVPTGMVIYTAVMMMIDKKLMDDLFSIILHTLFKNRPTSLGRYVWCHDIGGRVHGGTKAMKDTNTILINSGWQIYDTSCNGSALKKVTGLIRSLIKLMSMPTDNVFFVQLPQYGFVKRTLAHFIIRRFKSISLLHDIDSLRTVKGGTSEKLASCSDYLISTGRLHEYLPSMQKLHKFVQLEAWDYLLNLTREISVLPGGQVIYAGSMGSRKSIAIFRPEIKRMPLVLYGTLAEPEKKLTSDIYMGAFNSEDPNIDIDVSWGLIWEGGREDVNSLIGNDYEKINQPHKLSFYLACGIPVIVWSGSYIASYVTERKCGVVITTLDEIQTAILNISPLEFEQIRRNAQTIGLRLRQGMALKEALATLGFPSITATN